ncbi:hypothetical protein EV138_7158 [Kribbella voronezhensis]|uniref:Fibronectin type-III domain-containing protein n=1 Tax=Kribbella voronezhensis TaxID=2512212 RepID=A0A4R7SU50_9ACTN|nr:hypothetical protein [Kribbella voronezhensis]TDU82269.1 hypothetical protein EV138_7158 [Kribbella voronezhensis]
MRIRPAVALLGALVLASGTVVVARLSGPAEAALAPVEGRLLAADPDPVPHGYQFESSSSDYFSFYAGPSETRQPLWEVRSTVDGSVARTDSPTDPNWTGQEIAGRLTVTRTTIAAGTRIDFTGLAGASAPGPITVPAGDTILAVHEKGVLVRHDDGATSEFRVLRSNGTTQPVTGLIAPDASARVTDQDGDTLLLQRSDYLDTVDITTAVATPIVQTGLALPWAALTPNRIVWETSAGGSGHQLTWKHRDGSAGGSVTVPDSEDLTTFGDDVAVLRIPADGTSLRRRIVPVRLATGQVENPVIDDVAAARALADGRLMLARTDAVIALKPDLTQVKLADVAAPGLGVGGLAVSGGRVLNGFEDGTIRETTLTADKWIPSTAPKSSTGQQLQLGGGTLLNQGDLVVSWAGGQRALNKNGYAELGRGGDLLSYVSYDDQSTASIQNPRTGAQLAARPTARLLAMDGTWVWQGPDPVTRALTGTDLSTGKSKTVPSTVPCPAGSFAVAGRWALVNCDVHQQYVVDLLGVVADYRLPDDAPAANLLPALGDGFVARFRFTPDSAGVDIPELLVTDLNSPAHPERVVGPLRGRAWPPGASFALDDEAARIVYADPESRVRVATVDWLAAPPPVQTDLTAPTLTSSTAGPRIAPTRTLNYSYAFTDAGTGVASYDVRFQQRARGATQYGAWQQPAGWQKITGTKVTMTAATGVDTCFQVRARDKAANTSGWSTSACSTVDFTVPRLSSATTGGRILLTTPIRFSYAFTDDHTVASYDVAYRTATAGRTFGAWVYPSGWQGIASTSVTTTPPIGADTCLMVRARDGAGNVSAWSASVCSALPQDDRAFTAKGSVSRTTYAGAYRTTLSRLGASGASLGKDGESGNRIAVTVLAGPSQGAVDVTFAGRRIGRVSLAASTWSRKVVYLPVTSWITGRVVVTSVSSLPSNIDGVALLRF